MNVTDKLNKLSDMQAAMDFIRLHYQELRDLILTPEIRAALAEIDAEERTASEAASAGIATLADEIKAEVVASGATVKGSFLQAVWSKGRVSWDTKSLDGYAAAHPEIAQFRKEGAPSVSIRAA